jgi:hypothetical protein
LEHTIDHISATQFNFPVPLNDDAPLHAQGVDSIWWLVQKVFLGGGAGTNHRGQHSYLEGNNHCIKVNYQISY